MFLENNWGGSIVEEKKYDREEGKCIDPFKTHDSTEDTHILAFDESKPSLHIFAKVSRKITRQHLATTENINHINMTVCSRNYWSYTQSSKRKKCDSVNDGYANIGIRPD